MKARITMVFGPDGAVKTEVNGVKGKSCTGLTAFLDKEFGSGERRLKAEYYQLENVQACTNTGISPL